MSEQPEATLIAEPEFPRISSSASGVPETLPEAPTEPDTEPHTAPAPPERKSEPEPFEPDWPAGRPEPPPKA